MVRESYRSVQMKGMAGERPRKESALWLSVAGARVPGSRESGGRKLQVRSQC